MEIKKDFRITDIHAFVAVAPDTNSEGLVAMTHGLMMLPLIAADTDRLESLRLAAKKIATATKQEIKVIRFTVREEIETIKPEKQ